MTLHITGAASGIAAGKTGCGRGPEVIKESPFLTKLDLPMLWNPLITPQAHLSQLDALPEVARMCELIAHYTVQAIHHNNPFLTLGGDHSCAIGTWSGAASTLATNEALGLIWVDAHLDGHTPSSSPSGNIHGMPLAALLGHGDPALTQLMSDRTKLLPENTVAIGIRSYEPEEEKLFKELGVRIYFMPEVEERGLNTVMQEAMEIVTSGTHRFGISIDLDGLRPEDAPAVGTPAKGGIIANEFLGLLPDIARHPLFLGAEITEFNPDLTHENTTERLVVDMIEKLFG